MATPPDASRVERAADILWDAWLGGVRLTDLPAAVRPHDADEGLAIQAALERRAGVRVGWKIAATSAAGQTHIGVDAPIRGRLFERFVHDDGAVLSAEGMHMKVVEAEFAFRLSEDLDASTELNVDEVMSAVEELYLAIEVPDSRFERFELVGEAQLLADDACAARFVLGPEAADWRDVDLSLQEVEVRVNDVLVAHGGGMNVLTDPRVALTWLANALREADTPLRSGEVVTTGTTTVPAAVGPGDMVVADFGILGCARVSFE